MRQILNLSRISAGRSLLSALALAGAIAAVPAASHAQNQVFYENFETNHNSDGAYKINVVSGGSAVGSTNNLADLFCDYTSMGVPLSPHSTNSSTHALKLCCNLPPATVFPTGISVSPVGFNITDNFDMHFDAWWNFDGPMPGGGPGSTEIGGAGYGTAGTVAQVAGVADSVYIGAATDGNTSSSARVYSSYHPISYQGGSYRIGSDGTNNTTLGDPSSGYVYAGTNGSRDMRVAPFVTEFPSTQCPTNQFLLFPQQTNSNGTFPGQPGFSIAGSVAFKWHDVSLSKIANVITYKIDGFLIATVDVVDAGPLGGANILFNMYDINNTGDTQANATNLLFYLVDNVRITNFANVVSVSNASTAIYEASNNIPGVFTITRTSSGVPLTVNYSMTGTASNGVDYTDLNGNPLSGTITFSQNATSTNVFVKAVDDNIAELTESIVLNINPSTNYTGAGNATIRIVDNETPQLSITNVSSTLYERTNDFAVFKISRLGDTNTASFPVNLSFSGTATKGVNFYTNTVVTFEPGQSTTNLYVYPIEDGVYTGDKTITVNLASGTGYTVSAQNSASVTLRDENTPAETVLWSDNFNTDTTGNWSLYQVANDNVPDYIATFNLDYSVYGIPPSPHGGGDTHGLFLTVNKNDIGPAAAAVNLYPIGQTFSGNYALRFDMWLNTVANSTITTEYALAGINHSGTKTNWWRSGGITNGSDFDGVWYAIETDAQSTPNFQCYGAPALTNGNPTALTAGANSSSFTDIFSSPPFTVAGSPAVNATNTINPGYWSDVEIAQIGNVVTLRINNKPILSYSNSTPSTAGNIMVGYLDAFDSIGSIQGYEVIDNVRVVSISGLSGLTVVDLGASIQLDFSFGLNASPAEFAVQSTADFGTAFADTAAAIVQTSPGHYRATVTKSGAVEYYRIRHL